MSHDSHSQAAPSPGFGGFVTVICCAIGLLFVGLAGTSFFVEIPIFDSWWNKRVAAKAEAAEKAASEAAAVQQAAIASDPNAILKINLDADPALIAFKEKELRAKAGANLEITFTNPSLLPHNVIFGQKDSLTDLVNAANAMMSDPNGMAKSYIPESDKILGHSKLLQQGQSEVISFKAPAEPGEYPYFCSFPGHAMIMQGKLILE